MNKEEKRKIELLQFTKSLTKRELKTLQRDNPFVSERNALIQTLYARGVKLPLLSVVTGMPKQTLHNIAIRGYVNGRREKMQFKTGKNVDLSGVRRAIKTLWKEILTSSEGGKKCKKTNRLSGPLKAKT